MGDTKIPYLEKSWPVIKGCTRVSEGCRNCWAERQAIRLAGKAGPYAGLVRSTPQGPRWTGEVRLDESILDAPLRWRRPRRIGVAFTGDLFHERVKIEWIADIFGVMAVAGAREYPTDTGGCFHRKDGETTDTGGCFHRKADGETLQRIGDTVYRWPRHSSGPHTFLVLTKRSARMRKLLSSSSFRKEVSSAAYRWAHNRRDAGYLSDCIALHDNWHAPGRAGRLWPLPNVWLGVSVEDQATADARIPHLLATPAAVRWVSYEPALGPVDFTRLTILPEGNRPGAWLNALTGYVAGPDDVLDAQLDWISAGGESGPSARPCDVAWLRSVVAQCRAVKVPVYVKQLGARIRSDGVAKEFPTIHHWLKRAGSAGFMAPMIGPRVHQHPSASGWEDADFRLCDRAGADRTEWPEDLRMREMPR